MSTEEKISSPGTTNDQPVRGQGAPTPCSPTPGPWEVDAFGSPVIYGQSPKGRMRVADIRGWGHLTGGGHGALGLPEAEAVAIQEANARLIAAAPDLLVVCREALAEWPGSGSDTTHARMAAAIRKAEGR